MATVEDGGRVGRLHGEHVGMETIYEDQPTEQSLPAPGDTAEFVAHLGRASILEEIREAEFPLVRRGYDRESVDAYIARVSQLVEDLEATRSPQGAVNRALEELGEETSGILRQAQESANQITARSAAEATERLERAEREATAREAEAEAHVRRLDDDTDRTWEERRRLIDDARGLAESLLKLADDADERFPAEPRDVPEPDAVEESTEDDVSEQAPGVDVGAANGTLNGGPIAPFQ